MAAREWEAVHRIARSVVAEAGARTQRGRILALRDYVRRTVSNEGLPQEGRPFLCSSAAETLRRGKGWCSEGVRAFIILADGVDIPAPRINLFGQVNHVVAEAQAGPDEWLIVDCQQPPQIPGLKKLDHVILRPDYDD